VELAVVIPTLNSSSNLPLLLESLLRQSDREFAVVVADDPLSKDDTESVVRAYADRLAVRYIMAEETGISAARNRGILAIDSDIDCFVDSDCVADENWIKRTRECWGNLEDNSAGLRGKVLPKTTGFWTELLCNGVYVSEIHRGGGDNISYRRKALLDVGLFDPMLTLNEDGDLAGRVRKEGYRIEYDDKIVVYHDYGFTIERFFKREVKFGRGFYMLWEKTKDPGTIAPVLFGFSAFLFILISFLSGTLFLLFSLIALPTAAILYYRRYIRYFLRRKSVAYVPVLLALYLLKNICNTVGFLIQLTRSLQKECNPSCTVPSTNAARAVNKADCGKRSHELADLHRVIEHFSS